MPSSELAEKIRRGVEEVDDVRVADLHLWELGPVRRGCIVSLVTAVPRDTSYYRNAILQMSEEPANATNRYRDSSSPICLGRCLGCLGLYRERGAIPERSRRLPSGPRQT